MLSILAVLAGACENKGFDDTPEDPYAQSGEESETITADTVWLNQFTRNKGIKAVAVIDEDGDTVEYALFDEKGRPELYLNGQGGVQYEYDEEGRPVVVYTLEGSSVSYYTLEYKNDADLLVPVYDNLGPGMYDMAAIHADDPSHFSVLAGLSKVTKRSQDNKTIWNRKYVYIDGGSKQWMKVYTENQSTSGTRIDRIEYEGKQPACSDSLSIDTIVFNDSKLLSSYRYHYTDGNGAIVYETCSFRTDGGYLYPKSTIQEGGEYKVEYRYSDRGYLESVILGDDGEHSYPAGYEYDNSGNWIRMQFNGHTFRRMVYYY